MSSAFPQYTVVISPELDPYLNTLQEVLPAPRETVFSPNLLEALKDLRQALAPPPPGSGRHMFQCHVWQGAATNGLTMLLLKVTQNVLRLDQQGTISAHLFTCLRLIFVAGVESKHFEGQDISKYQEIVNDATTVIPLAIQEYWSKFGGRVKGVRGILKNLVGLGCIDDQLEVSQDNQVTSFHALDLVMKESDALAEIMLHFIIVDHNNTDSITQTVVRLSRIFDGQLPPDTRIPGNLEKLGEAFANILKATHYSGRSHDTNYKSTLNAAFAILTHPRFRSSARGPNARRCTEKTQKELGESICIGYWKLQPSSFDQGRSSDEVLTLTMRAFMTACYIAGCPLRIMKFSDTVFRADFVPLLARGLLIWQSLGDTAFAAGSSQESLAMCAGLGDHLDRIGKASRLNNPGILIDIVSQTSLVELLGLLEFAKVISRNPPTGAPIRLWKAFCQDGKLNIKAHEKNEARERARRVKPKGCSWNKCPMYRTGGLERREVLWCRDCKLVVYCGNFCQEKDWEGRHKKKCDVARKAVKAE
ncbi:hypothetical protein FRC01_003618 [Tulasnella sp. 417]|nr:hypothetical protein FRC01_003618 [Tulasnella sp. 417]